LAPICRRAVREPCSDRRSGLFREASGTVVPDGVTVGPDLLPGNPGKPGLEGPPPPDWFCWGDGPGVALVCDQAGIATATVAANARLLRIFFIKRLPCI